MWLMIEFHSLTFFVVFAIPAVEFNTSVISNQKLSKQVVWYHYIHFHEESQGEPRLSFLTERGDNFIA